jgi:hypothetical protein
MKTITTYQCQTCGNQSEDMETILRCEYKGQGHQQNKPQKTTKMNTAEDVIVFPINMEKLIKFITEEFMQNIYNGLIREGYMDVEFVIHKQALLKQFNIMTDNECCYQSSISIEPKFQFAVTHKGLKPDDENSKMINYHSISPVGHIQLSRKELNRFLMPEISLKEFMGSRFEYNPRISRNTINLLKQIDI